MDITKEALAILFETNYLELVDAWHQRDLLRFSSKSTILIDLLGDMERVLASDGRFLLGNDYAPRWRVFFEVAEDQRWVIAI